MFKDGNTLIEQLHVYHVLLLLDSLMRRCLSQSLSFEVNCLTVYQHCCPAFYITKASVNYSRLFIKLRTYTPA